MLPRETLDGVLVIVLIRPNKEKIEQPAETEETSLKFPSAATSDKHVERPPDKQAKPSKPRSRPTPARKMGYRPWRLCQILTRREERHSWNVTKCAC